MPTLRKKTLKVVPTPLVETVPTAPPALEVLNPTVELKCGNCGAVLMHGDRSKTGPLLVHCLSCNSYNSTVALKLSADRTVAVTAAASIFILSPQDEHQSTLLGIVRLCSRAEALLQLIFIHLSQSWHDKPLHRIVPILGSGVPPSGSNDWWFRWPGALKGPERSCALASEAVEAVPARDFIAPAGSTDTAGHPTEEGGCPRQRRTSFPVNDEINGGHNCITARAALPSLASVISAEPGAPIALETAPRALASSAARKRTRAMRPTSKAKLFHGRNLKKSPARGTGLSWSFVLPYRARRSLRKPTPTPSRTVGCTPRGGRSHEKAPPRGGAKLGLHALRSGLPSLRAGGTIRQTRRSTPNRKVGCTP